MYMYMYVCTMYVLCCIITINIVAALVDFIIATSKKTYHLYILYIQLSKNSIYWICSCLKIVYIACTVV